MSSVTRYSSLSQTFRVTAPAGVPGAYVSKLGLFFKKKSDSLGVQAFLMKITNGLPDFDKVIPGSLVTKETEDVQISTNGSAETEFAFPQLIYLEAGETYAFGVKPVGDSPDYDLWVGELGKRDLATDKPIGSNPLIETAYYSGNQERYADLVNQDVKFILYRAKFTSSSGTAAIRNSNVDVFSLYNLSPVTGSIDIRAGDEVYQWANAYIDTTVSGTVAKLDTVNKLLYIKNSTGNFQPNTNIAFVRTGVENDPYANSSGLLGLARINEEASNGLYKYGYHGMVPKLGVKKVPFTDIAFDFKGAKYNGAKYVQDANTRIENNVEVEFSDKTRYWLGESEENKSTNEFTTGVTPSGKPCTNSSIVIEATMTTDSNFISPVIDLTKNNVVLLRNLINDNTTDEHTIGGGAKARYISKTITLENQMEAEDLKIYVTANKPAGTEVHLYTKIWNAADPESFEHKVWSKMALEATADARNTNAPEEYLEYVYSFANSASEAGNAFAAYQANNSVPVVYYAANSTGGTTNGPFYGGYGYDRVIKKFAVKLVLTTESGKEYLYPKINDLRVIALQM